MPAVSASTAAAPTSRHQRFDLGGQLQIVEIAGLHYPAGAIEEHVRALLCDLEFLPDRAGLVVQVRDVADVQIRDELVHRLVSSEARDAQDAQSPVVLVREVGD